MRVPLRKRRDRRIQGQADLTITSMVDMFTMILTFLLNFVDPTLGDESLLALPQARSVAGVETGLVLEIAPAEVRFEGRTIAILAGGKLDGAGREGVVSFFRSRPVEEDAALVVAADKSIPFATVGEVLQAARVAGFTRYRFQVDRHTSP